MSHKLVSRLDRMAPELATQIERSVSAIRRSTLAEDIADNPAALDWLVRQRVTRAFERTRSTLETAERLGEESATRA